MFPGLVISALLIALMLRSSGSQTNTQQPDNKDNKDNKSVEVITSNEEYIVIRKEAVKG